MKVYVLAAFLLVAAVAAMAAPLDEFEPQEFVQEERADRHRRVTCDLLSIQAKGISVEHAACAANCLSMGKAGGRCQDGVCNCRKTTFKDLWDKRFG